MTKGCQPQDCCGDPSAHEPTLDERAEEAASNAKCARCQVRILGDVSASGVVFGRLIVPILGVQHEYQLCGKCGLGLREFVYPQLLNDPVYVRTKDELVKEFWT